MSILPPGFVHVPAWYDGVDVHGTLERELPWKRETMRIYGRECLVPRETCWVGDASYTYSGVRHESAPWHPIVAALRSEIAATLGGEPSMFNSCLANLYRGGADSVAWHSDDEPELGPEPLIASLSLGSTRAFKIRNRASRETTTIWLEHGDLLVMSGRAQLDYEHAVPKTAREVGPRINLTFRKIG